MRSLQRYAIFRFYRIYNISELLPVIEKKIHNGGQCVELCHGQIVAYAAKIKLVCKNRIAKGVILFFFDAMEISRCK